MGFCPLTDTKLPTRVCPLDDTFDPRPDRLPGRVDWALGHAAAYGRFAEGDLMAILDAHPAGAASDRTHRADESRSLAQGTAGWARFGAPIPTELTDTEGTGTTEY